MPTCRAQWLSGISPLQKVKINFDEAKEQLLKGKSNKFATGIH